MAPQPPRPKCIACKATPKPQARKVDGFVRFDILGWATLVPYDKAGAPVMGDAGWLCRDCVSRLST